jgi:hypothetical protein
MIHSVLPRGHDHIARMFVLTITNVMVSTGHQLGEQCRD